MKQFKQILILSHLLLISVLFITCCSDPEPKILFKYTVTPGDGVTVTNITNAEGKNVLSYSMKTSFTSTYKYNKWNTYQVEGIEGEDYVTLETGEQKLVDTYFVMDVYERPQVKRYTTKDGKPIGTYAATSYNGQIYATERFVSPLPIRFYSYDGENIIFEKTPNSKEIVQKKKGTLIPHSSGFNLVYTKELDTLIILPKKMIEDSLGARVVGFTRLKLDGINEILPFIKNMETKEETIYDKIPSFAGKDFELLAQGKVVL